MNKLPVTLTQDSIRESVLPNWIVRLQCLLFAILFAIWAIPETILIRHLCLILGALLGVYVVAQKFHLLLTKQALPIVLIMLVFVWALFQLLYLKTNPQLQLVEFSGIWKRTLLGFIFAVGFGFAMADSLQGHFQDSEERQRKCRIVWGLIYFGLLLPTLIYLVKYFLTFVAPKFGLIAPDYLKLYYGSLPFYMPKTTYVVFCLPLYAVSLGKILKEVDRQKLRPLFILLNLVSCAAVLFVFYAENIKNGVAYAVILSTIFFAVLLLKYHARFRISGIFLILVIVVSLGFFVLSHIKKNESWSTLLADIKVAIQVDRYQHWKFNGELGYPDNAYGKKVSSTNYERIAWGVVGTQLILDNPLGYGLIERSFGYLAKERWPESNLHQSHSGWLDLTLGLGLPGLCLILGALTIEFRRCILSSDPAANFGLWFLLSLALLWCTTEVSQKVYFDSLIFAIAWIGALSMSMGPNQVKSLF